MLRFLTALGLFTSFATLNSQDIPAAYQTLYYYRYSDTVLSKPAIPSGALIGYLYKSGLLYVDGQSWMAESQNGYDTIQNVSFDYRSQGFFCKFTEVTNAEYREFVNASKVPAYYPDTSIWPTNAIEEDPYQHYYFQHKAYDLYPVLGVSHWQAEAFCKWKEKQLNDDLKTAGFKNIRLMVSLPSDAQWQNLYSTSFKRWVSVNETESFRSSVSPSYLNFIFGDEGYRCNFGALQSIRLQNLRMPLGGENTFTDRPRPAKSLKAMGDFYHLLGNAAEWTSTSAQGNLYNTMEYIYTMSGKIIPNTQTRIDSNILKKRLAAPEAMKKCYLIKGGSWKDDIYYLQPAAVRFANEHSSFNDVGFRYVVTPVPIN